MAPQKKQALYKITVMGDGGVGKTALTVQFTMQSFVEAYDPTIEDCYRKQWVVDDVPSLLEILDTAGQEEFITLRDQWIRDGDGFLIVYSICSRSTFERVDRLIERIQRVKDDAFPVNPPPFGSPYGVPSPAGRPRLPIVLIGNKRDQFALREVSTEEGQRLARPHGCDFFEASAKTNSNVDAAFRSCVRAVKASRRAPDGAAVGAAGGTRRKKDKKCVIL